MREKTEGSPRGRCTTGMGWTAARFGDSGQLEVVGDATGSLAGWCDAVIERERDNCLAVNSRGRGGHQGSRG